MPRPKHDRLPRPLDPNSDNNARHARRRHLGHDGSLDAQPGECAADNAGREVQEGRGAAGELRGADAGGAAGAAEGLEARVGEDKDTTVVRLEVVDLLAEEGGPELLAEVFDRVERVGRRGAGEVGGLAVGLVSVRACVFVCARARHALHS